MVAVYIDKTHMSNVLHWRVGGTETTKRLKDCDCGKGNCNVFKQADCTEKSLRTVVERARNYLCYANEDGNWVKDVPGSIPSKPHQKRYKEDWKEYLEHNKPNPLNSCLPKNADRSVASLDRLDDDDSIESDGTATGGPAVPEEVRVMMNHLKDFFQTEDVRGQIHQVNTKLQEFKDAENNGGTAADLFNSWLRHSAEDFDPTPKVVNRAVPGQVPGQIPGLEQAQGDVLQTPRRLAARDRLVFRELPGNEIARLSKVKEEAVAALNELAAVKIQSFFRMHSVMQMVMQMDSPIFGKKFIGSLEANGNIFDNGLLCFVIHHPSFLSIVQEVQKFHSTPSSLAARRAIDKMTEGVLNEAFLSPKQLEDSKSASDVLGSETFDQFFDQVLSALYVIPVRLDKIDAGTDEQIENPREMVKLMILMIKDYHCRRDLIQKLNAMDVERLSFSGIVRALLKCIDDPEQLTQVEPDELALFCERTIGLHGVFERSFPYVRWSPPRRSKNSTLAERLGRPSSGSVTPVRHRSSGGEDTPTLRAKLRRLFSTGSITECNDIHDVQNSTKRQILSVDDLTEMYKNRGADMNDITRCNLFLIKVVDKLVEDPGMESKEAIQFLCSKFYSRFGPGQVQRLAKFQEIISKNDEAVTAVNDYLSVDAECWVEAASKKNNRMLSNKETMVADTSFVDIDEYDNGLKSRDENSNAGEIGPGLSSSDEAGLNANSGIGIASMEADNDGLKTTDSVGTKQLTKKSIPEKYHADDGILSPLNRFT